jgi:hypothetical protein
VSLPATPTETEGRVLAAAGRSKMIVPPCPLDAFSKLQKSKLSMVIVWPSSLL